MTDRDMMARVYATIKALRDVVASETGPVTKGLYADQYNNALDRLIADGFALEEFKVPLSEIAPHRQQTNYITREYRMTEPRVDRGLMLAKMSAVLTYFDGVSGGQNGLRFRGPQRKR